MLRIDKFHSVDIQRKGFATFFSLEYDLHDKKTSQELPMSSSVILNRQVTQIVMNLGTQLSEL